MMDVSSMYGNHHHHSNNFHNGNNDVNSARNAYSSTYFPANHVQHAQSAYTQHAHALSYGSFNNVTTPYYAQQQQQQQAVQQTKPLATPPLPAQIAAPSDQQQQAIYSHSHLFSPSAAEYGIVTSSNGNAAVNTPHPSNSPVESYYESDSMHSYYASAPTSTNSPIGGQSSAANVIPPIISSENGLSYTNLDCLYNQNIAQAQQHMQPQFEYGALAVSCNNTEEKYANVLHANFSQTGVLVDESTLNIDNQKSHMWHHHSHPSHAHLGSGYAVQDNNLDSSLSIHSHVHNNITNMHHNSLMCADIGAASNCMSTRNQPISPDGSNSQSSGNNSSHTQSKSPNHASNLPTYKWMQLKRNVPKPQRKFELKIS